MSVPVDAHTMAVTQMRLGDHAFAHYADDDARWELFSAFCTLGLAGGEKVVVLAHPAVTDEEAYRRLFPDDGFAGKALATGQLAFRSMHAMIHPDREFTAERQIYRLFEEIERACLQGYAGLRCAIDMAWVPEWGLDVEGVMHRETHVDAPFARRQYAELCSYDRRSFALEVIDAMRAGHPTALLERPGDLDAYHSINGLHLIGDADMATRDQFVATHARRSPARPRSAACCSTCPGLRSCPPPAPPTCSASWRRPTSTSGWTFTARASTLRCCASSARPGSGG